MLVDLWEKLPVPNKIDKRPNYDYIQETIATHIRRLRIPANTRLPSEPLLIKHFGVSRTTIRKAIETLESQGLVRKVQGKGTFVSKPDCHGVFDSYIGIEPSLRKMGVAIHNDLIFRIDGEAPEWAREIFPTETVHVICRVKKIKNKRVAIEYRVVAQSVGSHISGKDLASKMLTEVLDTMPKTYTKKVSYTVSSRPITREEAKILKVPMSTPVLVRRAVYFNKDDQPMSVGLMVFLADKVKITFDFIRQERSMRTTLIV